MNDTLMKFADGWYYLSVKYKPNTLQLAFNSYDEILNGINSTKVKLHISKGEAQELQSNVVAINIFLWELIEKIN
jgi:hypothetical protein